MKFVIAVQELLYILTKCQNVTGNASMPILSNILVQAANNMVTFTATDLTVGVRCRTEAKVIEEGTTTLPAKKVVQLVRELNSVNAEVYTDNDHVTHFVSGASKFWLKGVRPDEFPTLPDLDGAMQIAVPQVLLKKAFLSTCFAVARNESRHELNGLLLKIENNRAIFTATNGKKLARATIELNIDPTFTAEFILPLKAAEELGSSLEEDGEAKLYLMADKIAVEANNLIVITKLLSGTYPDVSSVINLTPDIKMALHKEELLSLLRQVSLFADDVNHVARFTFAEGELKLNANRMDVGEGKVSMAVNYHGAPLTIAFNTNHFQEILRHTNEESIEFGLVDPFNPAVITDFIHQADEAKGPSSFFVLMPLRYE